MTVTFDLSEFQRAAAGMGVRQSQVRFAVSRALNDAAFAVRNEFIATTWPSAVKVRNNSFMRAALKVETANKTKLEAAVTNQGPAGNRAHLGLHAKGGTKQGKRKLAIPADVVKARRTGRGVPSRLRPKDLPRSFRIGNAIFQRTGKGKRSGIRLMYSLASSASIRPAVPFARDFERVVRREVPAAFRARVREAMKTARR